MYLVVVNGMNYRMKEKDCIKKSGKEKKNKKDNNNHQKKTIMNLKDNKNHQKKSTMNLKAILKTNQARLIQQI